MIRDSNFTLRVNPTERELIGAVAQKLERGESDTLRLLVRREAQRLGIMSAAPLEDRRVTQPADIRVIRLSTETCVV